MVYSYMDSRGRTVAFDAAIPGREGKLHVRANPSGVHIPDDEIPNLVAALQNYMSRRAREVAKEGSGQTKPCMSCSADAGKEVRHPAGLGRCPAAGNG
jgi:hypothetical protein